MLAMKLTGLMNCIRAKCSDGNYRVTYDWKSKALRKFSLIYREGTVQYTHARLASQSLDVF